MNNRKAAHHLSNRVEDLANCLLYGMYDEFARQFKQLAQNPGLDEPDGLAEQINSHLKVGDRCNNLQLVVSQRSAGEGSTITVLGDSAFFGDSWSVARCSFSL